MKNRSQPGYYPGFSTLAQAKHWDPATRKIVDQRLNQSSDLHFFNPEEAKLLNRILELVMPQDDRDDEHKIPLLPTIDERMTRKKFDGYIFEGTVQEDQAHRLGLLGIEAMSQHRHQKGFLSLGIREQEAILISLKDNCPGEAWPYGEKLSGKHYWSVLIQDAVSAYYAHPFAWDEIGFGGPAYPRGYARLTGGLPEHWEKEEVRYEWAAPFETRSDIYEINEKLFSESGNHGQSGTH